MEEIVQVEPNSDLTVRVVWSDDREARIEFGPIIDRSPVFGAMRDAEFFGQNARITHTGSVLA